ncbi:MAG: GNAT family N-acetyltransferase [Acidimicrobiales bacterium]|nr:GNAT family N-acetyltransferase [Acidimicrobiales bacterium]
MPASLRPVLDLAHDMWRFDAPRLNFETSFGTLAWERGGYGESHRIERDGRLIGWARLTPGYDRIRRMGEWDVAPPMLTWLVDRREPDSLDLLAALVRWADDLGGDRYTTSHAQADHEAAAILGSLGFAPDPTEPFGLYLQQSVGAPAAPYLDGYRFVTMAELDDVEMRAAAHRAGWEASTFSADDVRRTMDSWPYRADLDLVALTAADEPVGAAIVWFDESYDYGEFEPVGVSPGHRGVGLGAALMRAGLHRLHRVGASHAVVGARGDDDYPLARRLYRSVGFETFTTQVVVAR